MDRFISKRVVITLETGVGIEGVPVVWNEEEVIITYPDSDNYTVIFNPSENIMMVSVYADYEEELDDVVMSDEVEERSVVEPEERQLDHFEPDPNLRALKIADLHLEKKAAIKDMLENHFKNKVVRMPQGSVYDSPDFEK